MGDQMTSPLLVRVINGTHMPNDAMRAGRYLHWHTARRKAAWIKARVAEGRTVYLVTYTKATKITAKYLSAVEARPSGLYIKQGHVWNNCDGSALRAE